MKVKLTKRAAKTVKSKIDQFTTREFPGFVTWLKEQWKANPPALLAYNPPNHRHDIEDGTMDLSVGRKSVGQKRAHHESLRKGIFAYKIWRDGDFRTVLRSVGELSSDDQREAAMAFLLEYRKGSYVCNTSEWRDVAVVIGHIEGLENPFYSGICQAILEVFCKEGAIE